jgi:hypothetical protein
MQIPMEIIDIPGYLYYGAAIDSPDLNVTIFSRRRRIMATFLMFGTVLSG